MKKIALLLLCHLLAKSEVISAIDRSAHYDYGLFLKEIYKFLGSYAVQKDVKRYNVQNVADWGQPNKAQGLTIDRNNFKDFIKIVSKDIPNNMNKHTGFTPKDSELNDLNDIISITLKPPSTFHEIDKETKSLTIKREFLLSGDIQKILDQCRKNDDIKQLFVYVADTLYFDEYLEVMNLAGLEVCIIFAHTWSIQKRSIRFNLDGVNKHKEFGEVGEDEAGEHGAHGSPGVHFIGIVRKVTGSKFLHFQGSGGRGQNGQDGKGRPDKYQDRHLAEAQHQKFKPNNAPDFDFFQHEFMKKFFSYVHLLGSVPIDNDQHYEERFQYTYVVYNNDCCGTTMPRGGKGRINCLHHPIVLQNFIHLSKIHQLNQESGHSSPIRSKIQIAPSFLRSVCSIRL